MSAKRVYTPQEVDQIMEGARNGLTLAQIAEATKIHKSTIQKFLTRIGWEKPVRKRKKGEKIFDEKDNLWEIVKSNQTTLFIAQRKPVAPGYLGLKVHQAGRSTPKPRITTFSAQHEKNPR